MSVIASLSANEQTKLYATIWSNYVITRVGIEPIVARISGKSIAVFWKNGFSFAVTDSGELLMKIEFDRPRLEKTDPNFSRMNDLIASHDWQTRN